MTPHELTGVTTSPASHELFPCRTTRGDVPPLAYGGGTRPSCLRYKAVQWPKRRQHFMTFWRPPERTKTIGPCSTGARCSTPSPTSPTAFTPLTRRREGCGCRASHDLVRVHGDLEDPEMPLCAWDAK